MSLKATYINKLLPAQLQLTPGLVAPFAGATAPARWLLCGGQLVSRTTYAALFAAIGTTFGTGDGSTTFALPDLRGEFVRGFDAGRGLDSGRVFGSTQVDALQRIYGEFNMTNGYTDCVNGSQGNVAGCISIVSRYGSTAAQVSQVQNQVQNTFFDNSRVVNTATENRPNSLALNWIIKI